MEKINQNMERKKMPNRRKRMKRNKKEYKLEEDVEKKSLD